MAFFLCCYKLWCKTHRLARGSSQFTLKATLSPENIATVTWESDNTAVCTVSYGVVTALTKGVSHIKAIAGDKEAVCTITVKELPKAEAVPFATLSNNQSVDGQKLVTPSAIREGDITITLSSTKKAAYIKAMTVYYLA